MSVGTSPDKNEAYQACYKLLKRHESIRHGPNNPLFGKDLACIALHERAISRLLDEATYEFINAPSIDTYCHEAALEYIRQLPANFPSEAAASELLDSVWIFCWYQHWTRPQEKLAGRLIAMAQHMDDQHRLAHGMFCLGHIRFRLNRYAKAADCFAFAQATFSALDLHSEAYHSAFQYLRVLTWLGRGIDLLQIVMARFKQYKPFKDLLQAPSSSEFRLLDDLQNADIDRMGTDQRSLIRALNQYREAKVSYTASQQLLEAADCGHRIARTLGKLGSFSEALVVAEETLQLFASMSLDGRGLGLYTHLARVRFLKSLERWDDPELQTSIDITLKHAYAFGSPVVIALALEELAEIHVRNEDWTSALMAYGAALQQARELPDNDGTNVAIMAYCHHNTTYIKHKMRGSDAGPAFEIPDRF